MEIQLLTSSLQPHPDAAIPYIRGPYTSRPAEIQINDRLLGLYPTDVTRNPIVIYDWKTGQMMAVRFFFYSIMAGALSFIVFLSQPVY